MSSRRLVRSLAMAVFVAVLVTACGGSSPTTSGGNKVKRLAFFGFSAANSFAQATWAGVQEEAKKNNVETKFFDPNFDSTKQVAQIQDAITSGQYQVFVVQSNDGNAVVPPIKDAIKAGITVVGEFTPIGPRYDTIEPQVPGLIAIARVGARQPRI